MNIVAPAGSYEKMEAAVKAGADEVYFGLRGFGARRNNKNFGIQEILDGIDYAHSRGGKTLLTLNTIMKNIEIESTIYNFSRIYEHGIDAVIVQDLGFLKFLSENFPGLTLHGSTQMTVANHEEANFLQKMGLSRVVLARELTFEEIKEIRKNTTIELEVFVSGALCIAYSGNCYISSFIGGRSGNRGLCAYTCRKKFLDENNKSAYFLSPNDQFLEEEVKKLKEIGINAIKVEGRKKTEQYVYETVSYYNEILNNKDRKSQSYKLFNRGYSKGYFHGDDKLMNFDYSSNFGYKLGEKVSGGKVRLEDELSLGDGIQFVGEDYERLGGVYINKILADNIKKEKAFKGETVYLGRIPENTKYIYKNYSKELHDSINHEMKVKERKMKINAEFFAALDKNPVLAFTAENLNGEVISAECERETLKETAKKSIDINIINEKISELGDTSFELGDINIDYDNKAFFSFSELKQMKRECAEKLKEKLLDSYRREGKTVKVRNFENNYNNSPVFSAMVSNKEQEAECRANGIEKIYYRQFDVAKESKLDKIDLNSKLVSNLYQILKSKTDKKSVDWNLNIFNNYTVDLFGSFDGVETIFLSPELNYEQLKGIKSKIVKKAMVIYGYLKGMYIEYPIFEKEYKELHGDHNDMYRVVRNGLDNMEIYMDKPMNLIPKLEDIRKLGLDELRLDFTFEKPEEVREIIKSLDTGEGKYNPYCFERGIF
ncbi:U32 family peptidase [Sebaldella sp. S0638]|uniref:peptidase U32 family protein n=1 Tax=Sebaldella sp. S0638 TaxID=2957809 RepID=UPI00209CE5F3|nr:U32 family peptidase [Sebaldella sp. S0638]MCP1224030.1 U32 family peptidase [Sebaldella sp. S0638]